MRLPQAAALQSRQVLQVPELALRLAARPVLASRRAVPEFAPKPMLYWIPEQPLRSLNVDVT